MLVLVNNSVGPAPATPRHGVRHDSCERKGTAPPGPVNPHRPRRPRRDSSAIYYLHQWRLHVERTERRVRKAGHTYTGCPCCDEYAEFIMFSNARDELEELMRNRGRRARSLRAAVAQLDERYRRATVERQNWRVEPWWNNRIPWA
ncbi:hypothetical protein [Segniliparus rugosus]|nr:hypothetical protein [Segniliparus rugosus]